VRSVQPASILSNSGPARRAALVWLALMLALATTACGGGNAGFPREPGQYTIQPNSLSFDGKKYSMLWADASGGLHKAEGEDVRMQRDEQTFLEIGNGTPVVHLKEDEAVIVQGKDRDGPFESFWFPFFLGSTLGRAGGPVIVNQPYPGERSSQGPGYQYPPTDRFGREDSLHGSVERSKPQTPDYGKVQPAPYAVSGQGAGTGSGTAATNKSATPFSGQAGGTGSGSAASGKGTFSSGGSVSGGGTGVNGGSSWSSGSGSAKGAGGSVSRPSSPPPVRVSPGRVGGRR
jgi:hypothetical protein